MIEPGGGPEAREAVSRERIKEDAIFLLNPSNMNGRDMKDRKPPENEEILRNLLLNVPGAIYRCSHDNDRTMLFISDGIRKISGYPPGDYIDNRLRTYGKAIFPEDRKIVWDILNESVKKRTPYSIEYRVIHMDGTFRWVNEKGTGVYADDDALLFLDGVIFDIDEKKRTEERLLESEENYRTLVEGTNHTIFKVDEKGVFRFLNSHAAKELGGRPEDYIGKTMWGLFPKECADKQMSKIRESIASGKTLISESTATVKGEVRWYETTLQPSKTGTEGQKTVVGIATDITDAKKADERLTEIINCLGIPVLVINKEHRITHWNSALENLTGIKKDSVLGTEKQWSIFYPKRRPILADLIVDGKTEEIGRLYGTKFRKSTLIPGAYEGTDFFPPAGERGKWMHYTAAPLRGHNGEIVGAIETAQDVTDRIIIGEELAKSEQKFRGFIEQSSEGIMLTDEEGIVIEWNKSLEEMTGVSGKEAIGKPLWEVQYLLLSEDRQTKEARDQIKAGIIKGLKTGKSEFMNRSLEAKYTRTDGSVRIVQQIGFPIKTEKGFRIGGTSRDVTEHNIMEEALKDSEKKLAEIIDFLPDATLVVDKGGKVIAWNRAMEKMSEIKAEDMLGKSDYEYAIPFYGERIPILIDLIMHPEEDREKKYNILKRGKDTLVGEAYMPKLNEGKTYLWGTATALYDSRGCIVGAIESIRDITDRKKSEEALLESEERYRNIFENSVEGIFQSTPEGRYTKVNPAFAHIFGYDSPGEMLSNVVNIGEQLYANPKDRVKATSITEKEGVLKNFEVECRKRNGEKIWTSLNAKPVRDETGRMLFFEGSIEDITDRKRAAKALQLASEDLERRVAERTKDLAKANLSLVSEIGERRKAEEEVRKLTKAVETTPTAILLTDLNGVIEYVNPSIQKIVGAFTQGSIVGTQILQYTDDAGRMTIQQEIIPTLLQDKPWRGEINIKTRDGSVYATEMIASLVPDDSGNPKYFLANIYDITQRKKMEEELQKAHTELENRVLERTAQLEKANRTLQSSLKEKEVLIKEIHHRVKNNLQIISSLLSMQSGYVKDRDSYELFRESQDRIKSIALVHEKLYQSADLSNIDFKEYVRKLTDHLLRSYGINQEKIKVVIAAEEVFLDINTAIPCSLMINELVSNALKHAFPPGTGGAISIEMRQDALKRYHLNVSDNGSGFPEEVDFRNVSSLGLQLVNTLVEQLKGKIELNKKHGTTFQIVFPYTR
jgi:PAS domain S-box-containing protein